MKLNIIDFCDGNKILFGSELGGRLFSKAKDVIDSSVDELIEFSVNGIEVADVTFLRDGVVSLAKHYCGSKFFQVVGFEGKVSSNWEGAAQAINFNLTTFCDGKIQYIGPKIGNRDLEILSHIQKAGTITSSNISSLTNISVANSSGSLKRLFSRGLISRVHGSSGSGGIEYLYKFPYQA